MGEELTDADKQSANEYMKQLIEISRASTEKWKGHIHPTEMLLTHAAGVMAYAATIMSMLYYEDKQTGLQIMEAAIIDLEKAREEMIKKGKQS